MDTSYSYPYLGHYFEFVQNPISYLFIFSYGLV